MDCISRNQLNVLNQMRMLWEQHVYWRRLLIISILSDLKDEEETTKRLLRNPGDFGNLFGKFYGPRFQKTITDLLTEHLVIGKELIVASKNGDTKEGERLNKLWYENAEKMARAFALVNPYYREEELRKMLYTHLDLTKKEVALRLEGNYAEDVKNFDMIEQEALMMADYLTNGIVYHFPNRFNSRFV